MTTHKLYLEEAPDLLFLQVGDELHVSMVENPTTPYEWNVSIVHADSVQLTGSSFAPDSSSALGGGGLRTFALLARKPTAENEVSFLYSAFGDLENPKQRRIIHIVVER